MDQLSKKIRLDDQHLTKVLDFLPYPFILSETHENIERNVFHNKKFLEEIGYTLEDTPTIEEWYLKAYPDTTYRNEIKEEWKRKATEAKKNGQDFFVTKARIRTNYQSDIWYEVKASVHGPVSFVAFVNIHEEVTRKEELALLNENKNRILSILSHDLRSPVNNLQIALKMIAANTVSEEEKSLILKNLEKQVFQLNEFLDTTLHWTRMNFYDLETVQQIIDVKKITQSILDLYSSSWNNKKIQTRISITNRTGAYGDPEVLSIVFRNLISNAIKFTPVGGGIHVYDAYRDEKYVLTVENSGAGISKETISKIFNKQYNSESGTMGEKGLGLGLKLCLQLLEKNGGKLEVESPDAKRAIFRIIM